ncbi:hypothetical protein K2173_013287 [Erythroxylum novogranatense]|uniref:Uncharacterized protein n=1 Tax=Erythroxylum novogranatense TaxID=1862640 RepID=A0AAV8S9H3_9ROSI|nr:hypothetical protein K2173_013287 [Erythroxylum novogranatense]
MEDSQVVQNVDPTPIPPEMSSSVPPPPPPPPPTVTPPPPTTRKRPLEGIEDCSYFKLRAVLRDIRPCLFEALRTVDFRSCKGADEIREKMKLLMELYKQMTAETVSVTKPKNLHDGHPLRCENGNAAVAEDQQQDVNSADTLQLNQAVDKPSENKHFQSNLVFESQQAENVQNQSYIIGGSAFGWNFITFTGNSSVYYGRSKESFRAANMIE